MTLRLSPLFKLAFFTVLALVVLFFAGAVLFSVFVPHPTKSQASADANLFQAGYFSLTALASLLVGKIV